MRLNLGLLESSVDNQARVAGADAFRSGQVQRIVRQEGESVYQVLVGADRDHAETVHLTLDGSAGVERLLDAWDCTCAAGDETCLHAMAAALLERETLDAGERAALLECGARIEFMPFLPGHSTTKLIAERKAARSGEKA